MLTLARTQFFGWNRSLILQERGLSKIRPIAALRHSLQQNSSDLVSFIPILHAITKTVFGQGTGIRTMNLQI
jgi:hypothetical protein